MFLNHAQDFAAFQPANPQERRPGPRPAIPMPDRDEHSFVMPSTLLETPAGWRQAGSLEKGDAVWTLDGGFCELTEVARQVSTGATRHWHVPAGALNNCSDLRLWGGQYLALLDPACEDLFETPCVLAPISAMNGFRGIAPVCSFGPREGIALRFAGEEVIYAQTGTLLHVAADRGDSFFRKLGYGETRALLTMINGGHFGLDRAGFAPACAA